jgi:hypothetical protein
MRHLKANGLVLRPYTGGPLAPSEVLVLGPDSGASVRGHEPAIDQFITAGGNVLGLGLTQPDVAGIPTLSELRFKRAEHISACFPAQPGALQGVSPAEVHNRDPREISLIASGCQIVGNGVLGRLEESNVLLCQLVPWQFAAPERQNNLRRTYRRATFLVSRLLANLGATAATPIVENFQRPLDLSDRPKTGQQRWLTGLYADQPEEWDDPYRFFRW